MKKKREKQIMLEGDERRKHFRSANEFETPVFYVEL
jgi:hypothetical protein